MDETFKRSVGRPKKHAIPARRLTRSLSRPEQLDLIEIDDAISQIKMPKKKTKKVTFAEKPELIINSINLSKPMTIISPNISHFNANTVRECWVLSADFDQSDARFLSESAGRQCIAISCAALCFFETKPLLLQYKNDSILNWSTEDLNFILEVGDNLYNISKTENPKCPDYLNFEIHRIKRTNLYIRI